jgi:hypothetical protein
MLYKEVIKDFEADFDHIMFAVFHAGGLLIPPHKSLHNNNL